MPSVAALLVADACNVGLVPVIHPGNPALIRDRLSHVDQNYIRADTHAAANARLVDYQQRIAITELWGGGLVASVDGLRFRVPVPSVHAAPSPRFFGYQRGITWLNAVNDRFAGLGAIIITGTVRDSLYILDTLLNLDAGPKPGWWPPTPPATPISSLVYFACWDTGSPRASPMWAAPGSGAPTCPVDRPATTGR